MKSLAIPSRSSGIVAKKATLETNSRSAWRQAKFRVVCNARHGVTSRGTTTSGTSSRSSSTSSRKGNADKAEKRETGKGETAGKVAGKGEAAEGEQELGGENRPLRLVVNGGGAAGVFGAIRAKEMAPGLEVRVVEKSQPLGKVRISGGGRCNVTTGLTADPMHLSSHYPRGHRELKGSFFRTHGLADTVEWFTQRGVPLKTETDGRMFPVSDSSQSVIDCLLSEAQQLSVTISPGWPVSSISRTPAGQFLITSSKKAPPITNSSSSPSSSPSSSTSPLSLMADFVLIATGGSIKGHDMAASLGHSIIPPCPSLFTFNIPDTALTALAGVSLENVSLKLLVPSSPSSSSALSPLTSTTAATTTTTPTETADAAAATASAPAAVASTAKTKQKLRKDKETSFTQRGSLLFTHWGVSGPAVLKLSAWAARNLHASAYTATLVADFTPHLSAASLLSALTTAKSSLQKKQIGTTAPVELNLPRRFWCYLLDRAAINPDTLWAHVSKAHLLALADVIHKAELAVAGKGRFKDEFVTAGGVPLKEVNLATMESRLVPNLYFAGEILNVDGITGGFNFQAPKVPRCFRLARLRQNIHAD
ncbi:unnamed protein product [Closterium sp. Naga37s-1]|nr:unnamed protein product [Closterium sp. Naga37s-1]